MYELYITAVPKQSYDHLTYTDNNVGFSLSNLVTTYHNV